MEQSLAADSNEKRQRLSLVWRVMCVMEQTKVRIGSIVIDCDDFPRMMSFWKDALGYAPRRPPTPGDDFIVLRDPTGARPNVSIDGMKPYRNRLHLDLYTEKPDEEIERLVRLGATVFRPREPGDDFDVLADPEGNLFCVVDTRESPEPAAGTNPPADRVGLRDVTEADLPAFYDHQRDPEAARMAAFPSRDWGAFMAHWRNILAGGWGLRKTILFNGHVAGNIVSFEESGSRLVGYWLGMGFWGRGIATKALSEFLCLETARPLSAYVARHNVASIRVLEKCGFRVSGESHVFSEPHGKEVEELILRLDSVAAEPPSA